MPREVRKYMTDEELVERLLDWPYQGETMAHEAADRIEQLTAERDAAKAKVEQLGCELNVAKYGQPNFAWSVHVAAMAELQAERDRLTAIGTEMAESIEGNYYLPGVVRRWFIALSGESHE